jgi:hypothetical protein
MKHYFMNHGLAVVALSLVTASAFAEPGFSMTSQTENRNIVGDLFVKPDSRILPISANYETERLVFSATVSYLQLDGLRGLPGYDFRWAKSSTNDSGTPLADFVVKDFDASVTYKHLSPLPGGWLADVTGALKFQNGDLLSTATILKSYSLQLSLTREFGKFTAETGAGYRLRDKATGFDYRNSANAYVGGGYQFSANTKLEMYLDIRQGELRASSNEAEITSYLSHKLPAKNLTLHSYAFKGVSRNNRDLETGLMLKLSF